MVGPSSARRSRVWRVRLIPIAAAAVAAVIASVGLVLASDLPALTRRIVSGASIALFAAAVAAACVRRARLSSGRRHRAWLLIAAACTAAAAGNLWLVVVGTSMGPRSAPSPADILLLSALALGVCGVATYPRVQRRPTELLRMFLDGALIGGSTCFILSVTVFPAILGSSDAFDPSRAVPLIVPVLDLVAATFAVLLLVRGSRQEALPLGLAGTGFLLFAASDFASAILTVRGPFSFGTIVDLGWIAGWVLIGAAVLITPSSAGPPEARREVSTVLGTITMFVVFVVAAAFSLREARSGGMDLVPTALWLLVLAGAIGRQVVLIIDNELLRRSLEQRVRERTREIRDISARTDLLVHSVGDGIYGVGVDGRVSFVNLAGVRTLGYPEAELIGADAHALFHAEPPETSAHPTERCYIAAAIRERTVTSVTEDAYVRADGGHVAVEVTATPVVSEGEVHGAVVVFRDVTERREVDRLKSEFVSMVSHELRTPLTSIQGTLRMLDAGTLGELAPPARRMTRIALDGSTRLSRLINDILDIERIGSGVVRMEFGQHSVTELVEAAVGELRVLADRAKVTIVLGSLDGWVTADPDRINQTLTNLIGNAIKFSPMHRTIDIAAAGRGSFVEFSITDHGRGIPPEKLEAIFQRFEQVDSSDARDKGGSGLGLAISRSIVERHGGRIWAENNPAGGAIFRFTLQRAEEPSEAENGHRSPAVSLDTSPKSAASGL